MSTEDKKERELTPDELDTCGERAALAASAELGQYPWSLAVEALHDECRDAYYRGTPMSARGCGDCELYVIGELFDRLFDRLFDLAFEREAQRILAADAKKTTLRVVH